jgi:hypothetical protein
MFEKEIFQQIKAHWEREQTRCNKPAIESPSLQDLQILVETAFLGSLKREEGKTVEFSLAFISEIQSQSPQGGILYPIETIKFSSPEPLTLERISKLAPAFDKNTTAFAVELSETDGIQTYQIWGAIYFGPKQEPTSYGFSFEGLNVSRPDCFMITTISIGSLLLTRQDHVLGYFESGKFSPTIPTPFANGALLEYFEALFSGKGTTRNGLFYVELPCIEKVLFNVSKKGNGGIVIFIPSGGEDKISDLYVDRNKFTANFRINFLLEQSGRYSLTPHIQQIKRVISERLEALARLAFIDGALLVSTNWEVVGVGTKLTANKWNKRVITGPNSFNYPGGGKVFDHSAYGTRHNSTINFIGACPEAVGFVISEDGPIRAFVKHDEETILCWEDVRLSMQINE